MNFTSNAITNCSIDWQGTFLQGYIQATRKQMTEAFGAPERHYNDPMSFCWEIQFESGPVARVYDWKLKSPLTEDETYSWHIGGRSVAAVTLVHDAFREAHELQVRSTRHPCPNCFA